MTPMITLTNNHLCAYTDAGKSTYVFHTSPLVVLPDTVDLNPDTESLERRTDPVHLDRK